MVDQHSLRSVGWSSLALLCLTCQTLGAAADPPELQPASNASLAPIPTDLSVVGMTTASKKATLAAVLPARIASIESPEGSIVSEGEIVVLLADDVQRARMEYAQSVAASLAEVNLTRVRWEQEKREWDRLVKLRGDDYASSKELSDAYAHSEVARLEHALAKEKNQQAKLAFQRERWQLEEFFIRAPFTGYVSQHFKQVGETVDQLEGIVTIVQLDPLEVNVDCPLWFAPYVNTGDRVAVQSSDVQSPVRSGVVVLANRVADAASQTFRVKIELPNAGHEWFAGLKVNIRFGTEEQSKLTKAPLRPSDSDQTDLTSRESGARLVRD